MSPVPDQPAVPPCGRDSIAGLRSEFRSFRSNASRATSYTVHPGVDFRDCRTGAFS